MTEQWQELKETIIEMRDNNGTCTQQEVCKFLVNLMNILEEQMIKSQEPTENLHREREQAYMQGYEDASKRFRQEPCDDAISRQAVLEQIRDEIERLHYHPKLDFIKNDEVVEMALDIIDKHTAEEQTE